MALTRNDQFEIDLRAAVEEERKRVLAFMETAGGIDDYAAYQNWVGYLGALRKVEELCTDVRAELEKKR